MCDNSSAINISKNIVMHSRTKHLTIKYHFVREKVAEKEVRVEYVCKGELVADIFTKPLPNDIFENLKFILGTVPPSLST